MSEEMQDEMTTCPRCHFEGTIDDFGTLGAHDPSNWICDSCGQEFDPVTMAVHTCEPPSKCYRDNVIKPEREFRKLFKRKGRRK